MESFHASLKKEEVYTTSYSNFEEANLALFSYIEEFYNRNRVHSSINYLTPQEFEDLEKEKMA
ncbi:IS3 family transposase [Listeria grayi]|uniref:IS3 family transposase n=1 Tax=Listeria grayi TaxID=1641 RepID=UPI003629FEF0